MATKKTSTQSFGQKWAALQSDYADGKVEFKADVSTAPIYEGSFRDIAFKDK